MTFKNKSKGQCYSYVIESDYFLILGLLNDVGYEMPNVEFRFYVDEKKRTRENEEYRECRFEVGFENYADFVYMFGIPVKSIKPEEWLKLAINNLNNDRSYMYNLINSMGEMDRNDVMIKLREVAEHVQDRNILMSIFDIILGAYF